MTASVVATPATKMLAQTLLEAAKADGAGQAVIEHLGACRRGQEAALVTSILKLAVAQVNVGLEPVADLSTLDSEAIAAEEVRVASWMARSAASIYTVDVEHVMKPKPSNNKAYKKRAVMACHVVQWALREHLVLPLTRIAELTGRTDHTSVVYAIRRVETDPAMMRVARSILSAAQYGIESKETAS